MRFLLVEDNASLAADIRSRLALDGHTVDVAGTLGDAEAWLDAADYDLVLLDIMLPDGDGRGFLGRHRARERQEPVIVLTARSEVSDRVSTLDLGADDYVVKPFDFTELEARIRAVLRRRGGRASNRVRLAGLEFDPVGAELSVNGEPRRLRNRELRLLEAFLRAEGRILSKEHLRDRLFGWAEEVSENAIEVHVSRLRRLLHGSGVVIETVRGVGYRLRAADGAP